MDHHTSSHLMDLLLKAGASLNDVAECLETIPDEEERKSFKRLLGKAMGIVGFDMVMPIVRQHRDLDPDRPPG